MHQDPLLIPIGNVTKGRFDDDEALEEPDENEIQKRFVEFFEDAHPEFCEVGKVVQFKVRELIFHAFFFEINNKKKGLSKSSSSFARKCLCPI